jgi:hypothetical protein
MTLSITHSTVVVVADDGTSPVGSDEWNDEHAITGTVGPDEGARELLTAARTYYVRTDGSDSNTGLVDSAGGAFLTLQKAYDVIAGTLDLGGNDVTIDVGNGTYTAGLLISGPWTGGGTLRLTGDTTTPSNVLISTTGSDCISNLANLPGALNIGGFKLVTDSNACINHSATGTINIDGKMEYGACAFAQLIAGIGGAFIFITADYTISDDSSSHFYSGYQAILQTYNNTITLTGTPAFSGPFAYAELGAALWSNATFSGAATGVRYLADTLAIINSNGGGANYFPGDSAGSATNGGVYV